MCGASQRGRVRPLWLAVLALLGLGAAGLAWWHHAPETLPEALQSHLPAKPDPNPPLYRWRDDQDRVHVTDRPPEDGRPYETLRYHPDTNVVPPLDGSRRD
jgi:hypothetical protein